MKRENYDLEDRLIEFAVKSIDIAEALPYLYLTIHVKKMILSKKGVIPRLMRNLLTLIQAGDTGSESGMTDLMIERRITKNSIRHSVFVIHDSIF